MLMNRLRIIFLGIIVAAVTITPLSAFGICIQSEGENIPNGVHCEINKIKLFALNAEDCEKVGGVVKHKVIMSVTPYTEEDNSEK